ncbi:hypothetical protein IJI55_02710 [Candidatus Saccharibacteria bacterium]|nr:hypothetical protein [Candidatus Saccharibacteria bacterium]
MQKSKKRILGAAGLATVAGMTIVASGIPAPEAYAETSSDVHLKVTVISENIDIVISGPLQDGGATSQDNVTIPIIVTDVKDLEYKVVARQEGISGPQEVVSATIPLSTSGNYSGTYDLPLTLSDYRNYLVANYGYDASKTITYTLTATGLGYGSGAAEDSITFGYGRISIDRNKNINNAAPDNESNTRITSDGDPIISVESASIINKIHIIIRDQAGNIVWEGDVDRDPSGTNDITLPFATNGIPSGSYSIEAIGYGINGERLSSASLDGIRYIQPDGPGIPNTGGVSIAGLNIAQGDFLISSALAFCLVSLGGIYLLHRKQTRK